MSNATIKVDIDLDLKAGVQDTLKKKMKQIGSSLQIPFERNKNITSQRSEILALKHLQQAMNALNISEVKTANAINNEKIKTESFINRKNNQDKRENITTQRQELKLELQKTTNKQKDRQEDIKIQKAELDLEFRKIKEKQRERGEEKKQAESSAKAAETLILLKKKGANVDASTALKTYNLELKKIREKERLANNEARSKGNFFSGVGRSINTGLTAYGENDQGTHVGFGNVASFASTLGKIGGIAAIAAIAAKALRSFGGNNQIKFSASAMASGFSPSAFAALNANKVGNQDISENIADVITSNKLNLSSKNRFRSIELNQSVVDTERRFGSRAFDNLLHLDPNLSSKDLLKRVEGDLKAADEESALHFGQKLGLSPESILAMRLGKASIGQLDNASKEFAQHDTKEAINNAFGLKEFSDKTLGWLSKIATNTGMVFASAAAGNFTPNSSLGNPNIYFPGGPSNSIQNITNGYFLPSNTSIGNT